MSIRLSLGASRIFEQIQMGSTLAARWSANRIAPTAAAWARPRSGSSNHRRVLWEPTSVSADFCQSQLQESKIATCLTVHCKSQRMLCLHTTIGDKYCNELHSSILPVRVVRVIAPPESSIASEDTKLNHRSGFWIDSCLSCCSVRGSAAVFTGRLWKACATPISSCVYFCFSSEKKPALSVRIPVVPHKAVAEVSKIGNL